MSLFGGGGGHEGFSTNSLLSFVGGGFIYLLLKRVSRGRGLSDGHHKTHDIPEQEKMRSVSQCVVSC